MTDSRFLQEGFAAQAAHVVEEKGELDMVLGELLAAIGKAQRWGLDSFNPLLPKGERETNRDWICRAINACYAELADMKQVLDRFRNTVPDCETDQPMDVVRLVQAAATIDIDYQTSEAHHPNHVLIPVTKFKEIRDAATPFSSRVPLEARQA
jgi:hypothetical protein